MATPAERTTASSAASLSAAVAGPDFDLVIEGDTAAVLALRNALEGYYRA